MYMHKTVSGQTGSGQTGSRHTWFGQTEFQETVQIVCDRRVQTGRVQTGRFAVYESAGTNNLKASYKAFAAGSIRRFLHIYFESAAENDEFLQSKGER